jgi:hypothetical protein
MDGLLGKVSDGKSFARRDHERFEAGVVEHLCKHFRLPSKAKSAMRSQFGARTGEYRLTLDAFYEQFPACPVYFVARVFRKVAMKSTVSRLLSRFLEQAFTKAFAGLDDDVPVDIQDSHAIALVFPWPYLPDGMVLHNRTRENDTAGGRFTWVSATGAYLTMEPMSVFLKTIDPGWANV